jgi:hypothetical protein
MNFMVGCAQEDARLYGTWTSDADLSMQWNTNSIEMTDEEKHAYKENLGRTTLRFWPKGKGLIIKQAYTWTDFSNSIHTVKGYTEPIQYKITQKEDDRVLVWFYSDNFQSFTYYFHFEGTNIFWRNQETPQESPREYFIKSASGSDRNK